MLRGGRGMLRGGEACSDVLRHRPERVRHSHQGTVDPLDCPAMAKICHSCGKGPAFGHSRSHSMVATKRRFDPNLQKVKILVGKAPRRVYVCTRCLKAGKVTKAL
jgi:large subunit ribosomal protein L28